MTTTKQKSSKKSGGVLATLRAAKAEVKKKQGERAGKAAGAKGTETPADDEVTAARKRKIRAEADRTKGKREERHFADTPQQRISANAGARGRKAQAKRDGK